MTLSAAAAAGDKCTGTISVPAAVVGDVVIVNAETAVPKQLAFNNAYISAAGVLTIEYVNISGAGYTPGSLAFTYKVIRQ